ncbi:MAG: acyclic terpene utilization AtuA family protein [Pseudomonadota bacterium]
MTNKIVRIGCASGFWGDTPEGARQLIKGGQVDYLVFDYLAEITMSILARLRERDQEQGYATDFVTQVIKPYAADIAAQGLKIVVNAGGVNPLGCKAALEKEIAAQGLQLTVAAVVGDDVMTQLEALREGGVREMFNDTVLPKELISANAYLGAFPIAAALSAGADIVVTGRCVDSALVLGPLIHEFGWRPEQVDLLAAGSLAGHIIECGTQCTGGFLTDWEDMQAGWADMGFPIVECSADGSFIVTKPAGTGGGVTRQTIAEQITYETGDPRCYVLPDVICDFSAVRVEELEKDRVKVSGVCGRPPTQTYKVSATCPDGYRSMTTLLIRGMGAAPKAHALAKAIIHRTTALFERDKLGSYTETSVEVLGAEAGYGPHASAHAQASREVMLKLGVRHANPKALAVFAREIFPMSTSTVQGIAGLFSGRPKVQPVVRLFSMLMDKAAVAVTVQVGSRLIEVDDSPVPVAAKTEHGAGRPTSPPRMPATTGRTKTVPLACLAYARSGDKGDMSNIAVLARRPEFLPLLREQLTSAKVREYFAYLMSGEVERFEWPGLDGFNFLLHDALGGGGVASLRFDPQGKAHAQIMLELPVDVPLEWMRSGWVKEDDGT